MTKEQILEAQFTSMKAQAKANYDAQRKNRAEYDEAMKAEASARVKGS